MGIALWIQPSRRGDRETFDAFHSATLTAAREFGGPRFEPHITITSGIILPPEHDAQEQRRAVDSILDHSLALLLNFSQELVIQVDSEALKFGETFFKAAYYDVKPSDQLADLAYNARLSFVLQRVNSSSEGSDLTDIEEKTQPWVRGLFKPHVSVVYTNDKLDETKQQALKTHTQHIGKQQSKWSQLTLSLVRCEGPIETWQVLGSREVTR